MWVSASTDVAPGTPESGTAANYYAVTPLYVQAMGLPLMRGRFFTERDTLASKRVVIIDEVMARRREERMRPESGRG